MSNAKNVSDYRRRRKLNLIRVSGGKCCICGYDKISATLEFHHIDPSQKQYGIGAKGTCHDLEKDLNEVKKCVLLCANCHRQAEMGLYSIEFLRERQVFDQNIANQLREEKRQLSMVTEYYCSNCGKKITRDSKSGLCEKCSHQSRRIVKRPDREELKFLIRTKPFTQIASMYHVSDNAIRKWCDAENLPRKKAEINSYSDQDWNKI